MDREKIEKEFRAAEEYVKVSHLKPAGMEHFLNDLQELENSNSKNIRDITSIVLKVINDSRFKEYCNMKPLVIFKEVCNIIDPSIFGGYWAE